VALVIVQAQAVCAGVKSPPEVRRFGLRQLAGFKPCWLHVLAMDGKQFVLRHEQSK